MLDLADISNLDEAFARFKVDYLDSLRHLSRFAARRDSQALVATAMARGRLDLPLGSDPESGNVVALTYVPPGNFQMGHTEKQRLAGNRASSASHFDFSTPSHSIQITSGYFIGIYEIPHFQFQSFLDATGTKLRVDTISVTSSEVDRIKPITNVTWENAVAFCDWLSELHQLPVRLPTEVEWEYAARGDHFVQQYEGDLESDALMGGPWPVNHESLDRQWRGTIGMRGNVQEWCLDRWNERAYEDRVVRTSDGKRGSFPYSPSAQMVDDHPGPHVVRGASYRDARANKDAALRRYKAEQSSNDTVGFRIVVPVPLSEDTKGAQR
ncbi:MAG: SUMF1/EgtB/PvdO family nonheme iron enzyme [Planctomycetota bacterium]